MKMQKIPFILFLALSSSGSLGLMNPCGAVVVRAKIYDLEGDLGKQLYQFERQENTEGGKTVSHIVFKDMDGKTALTEQFTYNRPNPGNENVMFESYTFERPQSLEKALIKVQGNRLVFHHEKNGSIKDRTEDLETNTFGRDQFVGFFHQHWDALMKGEKIKARFILPDRAETIGFSITRSEEMEHNGKKCIRFRMTPSSFIVALVAKDSFFIFEKEAERNLLSVDGRTPVLKKVGDQYKNLTGRFEFEYLNNIK